MRKFGKSGPFGGPHAMVVLAAAQPGSLHVFAFGVGMGIKTIMQASAAPEFLGHEGYGALQGAIMMPVYAAQAATPFAAAMIAEAGGGSGFLVWVLLANAMLSMVAFAAAAAFFARRRKT